jgi:hypothetical protein
LTQDEPHRASVALSLRSVALVAAGLLLLWASAASSGFAPGQVRPNAGAAIGPGIGIVLLVAAAVLGLGVAALGFTFWPGGMRLRRAKEPQPALVPVRPDAAALLPLLLAGVLVAAVIAAVASGTHSRRAAPAARPALPSGSPAGRSAHTHGDSWVTAAGVVFVVAAVGGIAVLAAPPRRRGRPSGPVARREAGGEHASAGPPRVEWTGDPRRTVLTAYAAMTELAGSAGSERAPSEAPREFLQRRRALFGPAVDAADVLTRLYEEARFSLHPTAASAAQSARAAYNQLEAVLARETGR